jgi:hypothetical protein
VVQGGRRYFVMQLIVAAAATHHLEAESVNTTSEVVAPAVVKRRISDYFVVRRADRALQAVGALYCTRCHVREQPCRF